MKIEDKVVSLELAKRMKELGWDYETEAFWAIYDRKWFLAKLPLGFNKQERKEWFADVNNYIPAPDAIEIEEELKNSGIIIGRYLDRPDYGKDKQSKKLKWNDKKAHWSGNYLIKHWSVSYDKKGLYKIFHNENIAEALGKMWCYLKEKKLI